MFGLQYDDKKPYLPQLGQAIVHGAAVGFGLGMVTLLFVLIASAYNALMRGSP